MEKNNNSKDLHLETDNQDNNQQYGNYNQPNGQYNNQQYGNYNQSNGQYNNQQYGNYNQPNGQYNNQQYGNYNQPNGQYNNQQYGNYNQPNGQYNNQQYGNYNQHNQPYGGQSYVGPNRPQENNARGNQRKSKKIVVLSSILIISLIAIAATFMFFSKNIGASSPEGAVQGVIDAMKKEDFVKANNYFYYSSEQTRKEKEKEIEKLLKEDKSGVLSKIAVENIKNSKVLEVKNKTETTARVKISTGDDIKTSVDVKKIDGKWYIDESYPL